MRVERILGLLSSNIAQPFLRARQYLPPAVGSAQPVGTTETTRRSASCWRIWYSADFDSAANSRFRGAMQKRYNALPGGYSAGLDIAGQCIEAELHLLGDKAPTARRSRRPSIKYRSWTRPRFGQIRSVRQRDRDVFIRKCERKKGNWSTRW